MGRIHHRWDRSGPGTGALAVKASQAQATLQPTRVLVGPRRLQAITLASATTFRGAVGAHGRPVREDEA
jgi:hypothetical protein